MLKFVVNSIYIILSLINCFVCLFFYLLLINDLMIIYIFIIFYDYIYIYIIIISYYYNYYYILF